MPETYIKKQKLYTEAEIQVAIEEVNAGASVRSTAKKYHMSTSMLRQRSLHNIGVIELKSRGHKTLFPMHVENKLASYVMRLSSALISGFSSGSHGETKEGCQCWGYHQIQPAQ
ncbi:hypothetical protein Pmani_007485 [Petrolisthes manimaculis]|uniref:Uncharacterized protein n=1 Tax=Petrolisthes manimaculis TaxID=1843537 RepID=A0AAE1QAU3_9EUCA|nr:hypothetical protein Pmani_007485 [Petrolisthes manimaculis]